MYSNNSIVTITDIEVGDNALFCLSNSSSCCRPRNGIASGQWFLPGGSNPISGSGESSSAADFSRSRRSSAVLLNRRNNAIGPEGLYRCDVIDARNITKSLFIGIYSFNRGEVHYTFAYYVRSNIDLFRESIFNSSVLFLFFCYSDMHYHWRSSHHCHLE